MHFLIMAAIVTTVTPVLPRDAEYFANCTTELNRNVIDLNENSYCVGADGLPAYPLDREFFELDKDLLIEDQHHQDLGEITVSE